MVDYKNGWWCQVASISIQEHAKFKAFKGGEGQIRPLPHLVMYERECGGYGSLSFCRWYSASLLGMVVYDVIEFMPSMVLKVSRVLSSIIVHANLVRTKLAS